MFFDFPLKAKPEIGRFIFIQFFFSFQLFCFRFEDSKKNFPNWFYVYFYSPRFKSFSFFLKKSNGI